MKSAGGVMGPAGRAQIIRTAYPDAAFKRLKAYAHALGAAHGLRAAGNLAVGQIGLNQIDQRSAGLTGVRGWQGVRKNARLNLVAG